MHPVPNEVPVPPDQVEMVMLVFAERKFTGRVRIPLRVKPEAALAVEVMPPEAIETGRGKCISPQLFHKDMPSREALLIREMLRSNAHHFKLGMKLTEILCEFEEGRLIQDRTQWVTVG
jgi:hypothetical protein